MGARGWMLAVSAPLGLVAAFGAGVLVAPEDPPAPRPTAAARPPAPPAAPPVAPGTSCEDLLDLYVVRGLGLVGPFGWDSGPSTYPLAVGDVGRAESSTGATADGAAPQTTRATASAGGTTVQEGGVDEPDGVKTDGSLLVRVQDGDLVVADVAGPSVRPLSRVDLTGAAPSGGAELLLSGDTVVVVLGTTASTTSTTGGAFLPVDTRTTIVTTFDLGQPEQPVETASVTYDTGLLAARLHGDVVRLVLDAGLPRLDFLLPGHETGQERVRAANLALVRDSDVDDWLPTRSVDGGPEESFLDCADVEVPQGRLGLGTTAVVGFAAADGAGAPVDAVGLAGTTDVAYASAGHLYLAAAGTEPGLAGFGDLAAPLCREECAPTAYDAGTTWVHDLALEQGGTEATFVGAGEVEGRLADRWSIDEHAGVLRLALEASSRTADATSLVTLTADPRADHDTMAPLVEVGRLDGLGRGEDLTAVRWFDDLAVLVTFRRTDPLHVVDLSDVTRPTLLGELEIPGFSEYLHPLGADRLVGIGQGPAGGPDRPWGAQIGLFDVTDLAAVRRLDAVGFGSGSRAGAATDPRQLTWLPGRRTVLTVVVRGWRSPVARVAALRIGGGRMEVSTRAVDRGPDVDAVRLVPLPDERVVLVTADGARFYPG